MKNLFLIAIIVLGFSGVSFAADNVTANSSATIITPIAISKSVDLSFGNIVADADGGTVIIDATGGRTATGLVLPGATPGTISAATFTVSGLLSSTYAITLPATFNVTSTGSNVMAVSTFTKSALAGTIGAAGTQEIKIGATLTVGTNQAAGTYTNLTGLAITVAYN